MKVLLILILMVSCSTFKSERKVDIKLYKPTVNGLVRSQTQELIDYQNPQHKGFYCVDSDDLTEIFQTLKGYDND